MTIEFHCPQCGKLLKTTDDKAGVRARCPGCQESVEVPAISEEAAHFDDTFGVRTLPEPPPSEMAEVTTADAVATVPPDSGAIRDCPMCGAQIRVEATRCRFCGENLVLPSGSGTPTKIDAGDILNRAWLIFQREMGISIGAVFLVGVLNAVSQIPLHVISFLHGRRQIDENSAIALMLAAYVITLVVQYCLSVGRTVLMLNLARGKPAGIGDLFSIGHFLWRALLAGILFTLLWIAGFCACGIGALFVSMIFGPFLCVLIDRDCGVIDALRVSYEITKDNLLALFILVLATFGITMLGFLACGIGLLFAYPFVYLMDAVCYAAMSGLPTAEQSPRGGMAP